jgi:anion-transporting  ArsA/GET3 family ATPase
MEMRGAGRDAILGRRLRLASVFKDAAPLVRELLTKGSTLIVLGPGGVGKTTIAAALGIAAARAGCNTGVITIDPAQRLRDALGVGRLTSRPARIDARRLRAAGLEPDLRLAAMVLDVKRTWDGLVERLVPAAGRRRVLENSFYRSLTEQFAGAEAYAALEQLYELHSAARFEVEIVDTPPASHAFEFVEAPANLARLLDSRAARWLFLPYGAASKGVLGLANRAARTVLSQLESFAGIRTLSAISEFFEAAAEAAGAVSERMRKAEALLHAPSVNFVLVTTAEEDRLREAHELVERMATHGLRLGAIVLNRIVDQRIFAAMRGSGRKAARYFDTIAALRSAVDAPSGNARDGAAGKGLGSLLNFLENYGAEARATIRRASSFARELPAGTRLVLAPDIGSDVADLRMLAELAAVIANSRWDSMLLARDTEPATAARRRAADGSRRGAPRRPAVAPPAERGRRESQPLIFLVEREAWAR